MTAADHPRFPTALLRFWAARLLPWWLLVAAVIGLMQIAVCGIIHDDQNIKTLLAFLKMLPPIVRANLGGETLTAGNLPAFIAIGYNHPLVQILFMLFAVAAPTGMLCGEVQAGTMELILSRRVTRTHVYLCAALVTITGMAALVLVMFLGTVLATHLYLFSEPVPLYQFFQLALNAGLLAAAVGAIALFAAALFDRRATAVGLTVAYLVLSHFIHTTSTSWRWTKPLAPYTLFRFVNGRKIFAEHAWPLHEMAALAAILILAALAGLLVWRRKDLRL